MKKIIIIISSMIVGFLIFFLLAEKEINNQLKNVFLSNAVIIVNNFERECILSGYNITDQTQYIKLSDLDYGISSKDVDLENSYIAFSCLDGEELIYITLIGEGRYKDFAYINETSDNLSVETITYSDTSFEGNINAINASLYEEE
ncbi:MAG TPA: hypothetical protein PLC53_02995 [Bacilli bacterium]|nr:hypothetical protein [Bacilli bacterium]